MITYSDNARLVLQRANELAVRTGGLVCTEHILFGLLDVDGSAAQRLLNGCGVYEEDVIPVFSPMPTRPVVEMSARASRAVQNARGRGAPWFASGGHGAYFIYDFGRNVLGCKQRFARKGR